MKKFTLLIAICTLLACAGSVSAQKRRKPSPVQEEFGDRIVRDELSRKLEAADRASKRRQAKEAKGNVPSGQALLDDLNNNFNQIVEAPPTQDFKLPQVNLSRLLGRRPEGKERKSKPTPRRREPDPVMQEFGPAIRAEARRAERRVNVGRSAPDSRNATRAAGLSNPSFLPPFTVQKLPKAYKRKPPKDPHRATDPLKVAERRARGHKDLLVNQYRFPIKPGAEVYDARGKRLGQLAPAVRLEVDGIKRLVPQQIRINKNEGRRLKLKGGKKMVEMAVGVKLTNGLHVSGLVKREDIPAPHRPKQATPRRLRAPGRETIPYYITGGAPFSPPRLFGYDKKPVPLKFQEPNVYPPRGHKGKHQEANDYLPRPLDKGPEKNRFYVNLLKSLPGQGGIARSVVKIDRRERGSARPIFEVFTGGSARSRNLYLPGKTDPKTSLIFLEGRLRGAKQNLGPVFIAAPNLSPFPVPRGRH